MTPEEQLAETVRVEGARVLATLIRTLGSLQLAEDAVQDAAVAALQAWPSARSPEVAPTHRRRCPDRFCPNRCQSAESLFPYPTVNRGPMRVA